MKKKTKRKRSKEEKERGDLISLYLMKKIIKTFFKCSKCSSYLRVKDFNLTTARWSCPICERETPILIYFVGGEKEVLVAICQER